MAANLLSETWVNLDSFELRLLLEQRIGGPGQYDGRPKNPNKLYLPLAGPPCKIGLTFRDKKIDAIEPGPAFDAEEWRQVSEEIEKSILAGPMKVGREYSFSGFRVLGSWRGVESGVQILPPPVDAPRAPVEMAEHPFILEFPIKESSLSQVTNHRRRREHHNLTLLLNVLLAGRISHQLQRSEHFWTTELVNNKWSESKWVQKWFFAKLGNSIIDVLTPAADNQLEEVEPEEYYRMVGYDRQGLRVPSDLDQSICLYQKLSSTKRAQFERATFWIDIASRQWIISGSSSFTSLVSAVESLTDRGTTHHVRCEKCNEDRGHEAPSATERFRAFFDQYAPSDNQRSRRSKMYSLRSGIHHGSELMQLDQMRAFGWDPPYFNERELYNDLWSLTRVAMRNWLKRSSDT